MLDLNDVVALDDIAFLDIVVILNSDTALITLVDFLGVVLIALQ